MCAIIKKLFKKEPERTFDLGDWHPLKERYEVFHKIISSILERRDNDPEWAHEIVNDPIGVDYLYKQQYIKVMIGDLHDAMEVDVDIQKIIDLDIQCSGHVDYVHKFAFRLAELEDGMRN